MTQQLDQGSAVHDRPVGLRRGVHLLDPNRNGHPVEPVGAGVAERVLLDLAPPQIDLRRGRVALRNRLTRKFYAAVDDAYDDTVRDAVTVGVTPDAETPAKDASFPQPNGKASTLWAFSPRLRLVATDG